MKCAKCNNVFEIRVATKVSTKSCKLLGSMTTVMTLQCSKCKHIMQVPVQNKSMISVKKDKEE